MSIDTSATGGVLAPSVPSPPLEGQDLNRLIQQFVVGLTGLDGTLVRPRWQPEPSNIPTEGEAWCAVGITTTTADTYPYVEGGNLQRHEEINILLSFYDLGTNGKAQYYAALYRDGAAVPQNLEYLLNAGMGMGFVGPMTTVPSLLKQRWLYRVDIPTALRRVVSRNYAVLSTTSADGTIQNDQGYDEPITVTQD